MAQIQSTELTSGASARSWAEGRVAGLASPLRDAIPHALELSHLGRYVLVAALAGLCAMLSAWNRIALLETSVQLDAAERSLTVAQAEQERLELELATLRDPIRLGNIGGALQLDRRVPVVDVTAPAVEVATR